MAIFVQFSHRSGRRLFVNNLLTCEINVRTPLMIATFSRITRGCRKNQILFEFEIL